jgi:hypothetical protein
MPLRTLAVLVIAALLLSIMVNQVISGRIVGWEYDRRAATKYTLLGLEFILRGQMLDEEPDIKSVDKAEKKAKSAKKKTKKAKKPGLQKRTPPLEVLQNSLGTLSRSHYESRGPSLSKMPEKSVANETQPNMSA